jgi:arylsulfatase A-like enzyme
VLLPEILQEHGYETAGFVTNMTVSARYGFDRGFDHFVDRDRIDFTRASVGDALGQLKLPRMWWRWRRLDRLTSAIDRWLRTDPATPFFLWAHQIMPHLPYSPPFEYGRAFDTYASSLPAGGSAILEIAHHRIEPTQTDVDHLVALYDAEIAFTEDLLDGLFDALARGGHMENTLVVFTSDHGEKLYDRSDYVGHGWTLYDEEIIVPLMFHWPGRLAGRRIDMCVETIDIAPTILHVLGLPPEPTMQGKSLLPLIAPEADSRDDERPVHPDATEPAFAIDANSRMVRVPGWKYIENDNGVLELYDLSADPGETRNLVTVELERAAELRTILHEWDASVPAVRTEEHELDEESIRTLRALGYIE